MHELSNTNKEVERVRNDVERLQGHTEQLQTDAQEAFRQRSDLGTALRDVDNRVRTENRLSRFINAFLIAGAGIAATLAAIFG